MKNISKYITIILTSALITPLSNNAHFHSKKRAHHWNWSKINTNNISFPAGFMWGSATSALQVEGNHTNNDWSAWERGILPAATPFTKKEKVGIACDHWNRYKEDIQIMKKLRLNAYRFSVEWSKIEPQEGVFDQEALDHYRDVCQELVKNGIQPVITLNHYTEPIWFARKRSFEKAHNIPYFVRFCQKVFAHLHEHVSLWLTFNSACSYAGKRYMTGDYIPAVKDNIRAMVEVMYNVLTAHVEVYYALKAMPGGKTAKIGILKNIYQQDPLHSWNLLDRLYSKAGRTLVDESMYNFFTTGIFKVHIPGKVHVTKKRNPKAVKALDFVGLNYYGHATLDTMKKIRNPKEMAVGNPRYSVYAEGFYRAIRQLSDRVARPLNIPIYVTENGIATDNENLRELFYKRYLFALSQAIKDGHNVKGYITWSFMDNYSWGTYDRHYGLIPVDRTTLARGPLKTGAKYFIDVVNRY